MADMKKVDAWLAKKKLNEYGDPDGKYRWKVLRRVERGSIRENQRVYVNVYKPREKDPF